jgi:hypothetical protein
LSWKQQLVGENEEAEKVEVEWLLAEEATIDYCFNLPVLEMAANKHHPNGKGKGNGLVMLNNRSQFANKQEQLHCEKQPTYWDIEGA